MDVVNTISNAIDWRQALVLALIATLLGGAVLAAAWAMSGAPDDESAPRAAGPKSSRRRV